MTIGFMIMELLNVGGLDLVRREHERVKRSCVHPQKSILQWKQSIRATFLGKQVNMTVIQWWCLATAKGHLLWLFKEKTTSSQNLYERVMGIQDCGYLNDNGKGWWSWMVWITGGTLIPHKDILDSTNMRDKSQIDHVLMGNGGFFARCSI